MRDGVEAFCDVVVEGDLFELLLGDPTRCASFLEQEFKPAVVAACQAWGAGLELGSR